jgi:hypothetical protein
LLVFGAHRRVLPPSKYVNSGTTSTPRLVDAVSGRSRPRGDADPLLGWSPEGAVSMAQQYTTQPCIDSFGRPNAGFGDEIAPPA